MTKRANEDIWLKLALTTATHLESRPVGDNRVAVTLLMDIDTWFRMQEIRANMREHFEPYDVTWLKRLIDDEERRRTEVRPGAAVADEAATGG